MTSAVRWWCSQRCEIPTLLIAGSNIELLQDKKCVLHITALHDADQIAEFVLDKGDIPFDLKDKVTFIPIQPNYHIALQNGETALHIAYKKESYKVQELLILEGADDTIRNNVSAIHLLVIMSADLLR